MVLTKALRAVPRTRPYWRSVGSRTVSTPADYFSRNSPNAPVPVPWIAPASIGSSSSDHEASTVRQLRTMLADPRPPNGEALLADCDKLWTVYRSLSTARRHSLPASLKRQLLRRVVPPWQVMSKLAWQQSSNELPTTEGLGSLCASGEALSWEQRLALVMSDLAASTVSDADRECPDLHDYNFVIHHFAALGHIAGCETLAREMAGRGLPTNIKTANCRLAAIARWLALQKSAEAHNGSRLAKQILDLIRTILAELRQANIPLRRLTVDHLLRIVARLRQASSPTVPALDELFEEILERSFAGAASPLDLLSGHPVGFPAGFALPAVSMQTLNLVLRDLGSRGLIWEMLSAFASLGETRPPIPWRLRTTEEMGQSDDTGPVTLSEAIQAEAEGSDGLSFFGRPKRTADTLIETEAVKHAADERHAFSNFLSPIPLPSASFRQFSCLDNQFPPPFLPHSYHRPQQPGVNTETFTVLIHQIVSRGDFPLALHALRTGIREACAVRTEWYAAYAHALRSSTPEESLDLQPRHAGKIHQQLLRPSIAISPGWFDRVLRTAQTPKALAMVLNELKTTLENVDDENKLWTELRATILEKSPDVMIKPRGQRDPLSFDMASFTSSIKEQSREIKCMIAATESKLEKLVARRRTMYAKRK